MQSKTLLCTMSTAAPGQSILYHGMQTKVHVGDGSYSGGIKQIDA